jgi:septal ring factor EnvC (AmiA/AmiB activator)
MEIVSLRRKSNKTTINGKIYKEYEAKLADGYSMQIRVDRNNNIQSIIYDNKVILDIDDPVSNIAKKAREIVKMSIAKRLKDNRKIDTKAKKEVQKISSKRAELIKQKEALENEIKELEAQIKELGA